ncbi:REP element-mobilizing transposase RayT [Flavobacterium piscis]|uniref:REP element-mobilizing transposase RayT n=1 Tax=Flavobacterium piscis TaxID=1114874 RepID=A0ABU1YB55_9FLAO|nr:REP element-mobilizing transposase RayT [Flavobacterium piscis]
MEGDIKIRCRTILIQICEAEDIQILKGVVSKDHIHMHIEYRPSQDISSIVKLMKGRSSRKLQMEFSELKKRYNYNVDLYKNFFNTDIKDNVNYISLDVNNNDLPPFKDYFLEAGDAIYENNCLFLNYKRYVVCFKKEDKYKVSDKKSSELPFDFERVYRLCQKDNRSLCKELCNNEYHVFELKNESELKENLKLKLNNKNPFIIIN